MSIVIDKSKCIGCKRCRNVCPGSLIKTDENGKAYIKYPKDCWGCSFFLGSDIGGMGSKVHTEKNGDILSWLIEKPHGEVIKIDINQKESNKY